MNIALSDERYLAAVSRGDIASAQMMVCQAAEEAGYPSRIWHHTATASAPFDEFRYGALLGGEDRYKHTGKKGALQYTLEGLSCGWLTDSEKQFPSWKKDDLSNVYPVFLRLENPLVLKPEPGAQARRFAMKARLNELNTRFGNPNEFIPFDEHQAGRAEQRAIAQYIRPDKTSENRVIEIHDNLAGCRGRRELEREMRKLEKIVGTAGEIHRRRDEIALSDPFGQLENMSRIAQNDFPELVPGAALRAHLKQRGHDGVILVDTNSDTSLTDSSRHTWAVPFDGGAQIKSAAAVARDKHGRVYPLSVRFDRDCPCMYGKMPPVVEARGMSEPSLPPPAPTRSRGISL